MAEADRGVGYALDNALLLAAAVLVFFMQAGFAMVEAGLNNSKNAVNILFKNSMDICVGVLLFFAVGFGIMYGGSYSQYAGEDAPAANAYVTFGGFAGLVGALVLGPRLGRYVGGKSMPMPDHSLPLWVVWLVRV